MSANQNTSSLSNSNSSDDFFANVEFDPAKFFFLLKRSLWWILIILFAGLVGSYLYLRYTEKIFEASAVIKLEIKNDADLLDISVNPLGDGKDKNKLAGEIELIKSEIIYDRLIDSLGLGISYYAKGNILNSERFESSSFKVIVKNASNQEDRPIYIVFKDENSFLISKNESFESATQQRVNQWFVFGRDSLKVIKSSLFDESNINENYYFVFNSDRSLYSYFNRNLGVAIESFAANTLKLIFKDPNRSKAIKIIENVIEIYKSQSIESKNQVFEQSLQYLEDQLVITKDTLSFYEDLIAKLTEVNKIPEVQEVGEAISTIRSLEEQMTNLKFKIDQYEKLENYIYNDSSSIYLYGLSSVIGNSQLSTLITRLVEIESNFKRASSAYKNSTEALKNKLASLTIIKEELFELIKFNKSFLEKNLKRVKRSIRDLETEFYELAKGNPELRKINKNYSIYEKVSDLILNKKIEISIAKAGTVPNFKVISQANASSNPISPIPLIIYGIGFGVGLFISSILIIIKYLLQNRINSMSELEKRLKIPVIGVVPLYRKRKLEHSELIIDQNPKSSISEAFRSIRTSLDFVSEGKKQKLISVTSTVSGEGKTFVALNLAGVIALSGLKVVLIDLDLRKPKVHLGMGVMNQFGITSYLVKKAGLEEIINKSKLDSLDFITAGPTPPNPSELLMSESFKDLISKLKETYDVILMDSPPVGLVTDGIQAMKMADIPVFVFRTDYSKLAYTIAANKLVSDGNFKHAVAILNGVGAKNSYGYGYGYTYGGSYGYGYGTKHGGYAGGYYEE